MLKMLVRTKAEDGNGGWTYNEYPVTELKFKRQAPKPEPEDDEEEFDEE